MGVSPSLSSPTHQLFGKIKVRSGVVGVGHRQGEGLNKVGELGSVVVRECVRGFVGEWIQGGGCVGEYRWVGSWVRLRARIRAWKWIGGWKGVNHSR